MKILRILFIAFFIFFFNPNSFVFAQTASDWYMAGANPARTSWVDSTAENTTEITGMMYPKWYRTIKAFIPYKVQLVIANDKILVSTARGLFAIYTGDDGNTAGGLAWQYPTELPLGHSPTVVNGIAYVGGFDHKIHAVDIATGQLKSGWNFVEADAGFENNPVVVNNTVYSGNRDGYLYALDAATGTLKWKFKTDGPITFSPAFKNNVVYIVSNDTYAYAVNATSGAQIWKSAQLPGLGFYSYWPVIYHNAGLNKDFVIIGTSQSYRTDSVQASHFLGIGTGGFNVYERLDLYNGQTSGLIGATGTVAGDWVAGTSTINNTKAAQYFESKPWRRTYLVLDAINGNEFTYDSDTDGKAEYAPIAWVGTYSGNRYPAIIGKDNVLYQQNNYIANEYIAQGFVSGWKFGTQYISRFSDRGNAVDEPMAYLSAGNLIYWTNTVDRTTGYVDITSFNTGEIYFDYNLCNLVSGYDASYAKDNTSGGYTECDPEGSKYGSQNGIYDRHNNQNPPIPYKGKLYMQKGNSIIAFTSQNTTPTKLAEITPTTSTNKVSISEAILKSRLETTVSKMIAGNDHLLPGYLSISLWDGVQIYTDMADGEFLSDYFHSPGENLYALLRALPYLSDGLKTQVRAYLQQEYTAYPPYQTAHVGWKNGVSRDPFLIPPEIQNNMAAFPAKTNAHNQDDQAPAWWSFPPQANYYLWKYAEVFNNAADIWSKISNKTPSVPGGAAGTYLKTNPHIHNAFIAGYIGLCELEKLAQNKTTCSVQATLNNLLASRAANFSKDTPFPRTFTYSHVLNLSRNFMYMVPELADYLNQNAKAKVQTALDEYNTIAPYWFVSKFTGTYFEGGIEPPYDYGTLFLAKAQVLKQTREELAKYLDVPGFARGDLFYIQNLVAAIEAPASNAASPTPTPTSSCGLPGDIDCSGKVTALDLSTLLSKFNTDDVKSDLDDSGTVNALDLFNLLQNFGK